MSILTKVEYKNYVTSLPSPDPPTFGFKRASKNLDAKLKGAREGKEEGGGACTGFQIYLGSSVIHVTNHHIFVGSTISPMNVSPLGLSVT
jgi:hypothetical protein